MKRRLFGWLWRSAPKGVRRWGVWLAEPRFTVTAGAVIEDEGGRVLLFHHVFRKGVRWGIPGGFLAKGEQPEEALRRELREEVGAEVERAEFAFARTLARPHQVEIIFRCRMRAASITARSESFEVDKAKWFERDALPTELGPDQRRIIERALDGSAHAPD
ncbi:MAG: NUDIX hydrolase [Acidobacteria bacterium]|nr:NUDIX hydrolase [Acidobacteriota bacterium]